MQAIVGFLVGVVVSAAVWVYLDVASFRAERRDLGPPDYPTAAAPPRPAARDTADEPPAPTATRPPRRRAPRPRVALPAPPPPLAPPASELDEAPSPPAQSDPRQPPAAALLGAERGEDRQRWRVGVGLGAETYPGLDAGVVAAWNMRITTPSWRNLAIELAYAGATGAEMSTTSTEMLLRWSPVALHGLRPFAVGGLGWRRYTGAETTDAATFPLGGGVAYEWGRWRADARVVVRPASSSRLHAVAGAAGIGVALY